MDINLTLLGQMITFAIFVWFTVKYVWPPIMKTMKERQDKIAAGLAAAEQGEQSLQVAKQEIAGQMQEAKNQAAKIIEQAHQRAAHIIEEAKVTARQEGDRIVQLANDEIKREYSQAKNELTKHIANIAVTGAEKILGREVDHASNDRLIEQLVSELE
ncbi:MAG: F0F1 ATP synthase subunit B [Proteobacteria bacterium]|nr:F0F1 ATP synthase subunit B [Pseudomonadota bacterium]